VENWLQLQHCSFGKNAYNFMAKKLITILNAYVYALSSYSFSCGPSLYFSAWLSLKVTLEFSASHINMPQQMMIFLDIIVTA